MCSAQEKRSQFEEYPSSPSHLLDNLLQRYEDDIKKEYRLINEVKSTLSGNNLYISTGLSPARGFLPVVKVSNNKNCISFTKYEWSEFEKCENQIIEHMAEPQEKVSLGCKRCRAEALQENTSVISANDIKASLLVADTFKLTFTYIYKLRKNNRGHLEPVVKIECRGIGFLLDRAAVKAFINIRLFVKSRLHRLELLDFANYYNSLITSVVVKKENIEDLRDYIEKILCQFNNDNNNTFNDTMSNVWSSEYTDCILEILALEFNKFKQDIGSITTSQL